MSNYIPSVGMEVHAELATRSKMFCRCPVGFGGEPNTRVCPVCLGLPGTLPVPNKEAIEMVLKTALALNCKIARRSIFHRKNYFYPDLPKGYQTSQYEETNPIGYHGYLDIPTVNGGTKRIHIKRVHLEEDTGKLIHLPTGESGVDYNRAGTPLMEIVTEFPPDIQNPDEAKEYLTQLRQILIYLGVCDGRMEEGSLRCEPNISVRLEGSEKYGTKTELKNLNSFRAVQLGVAFEVRRQIATLEHGEKVIQETRGWNENKEASFTQRIKEEENDYRYFPCPDLAPLVFTDEQIDLAKASLPELPAARFARYTKELGLSEYDAQVLTNDDAWSKFFDASLALGGDPKAVCNWLTQELAQRLNREGQTITNCMVTPVMLVSLIGLVEKGAVNGKQAKEIFVEMFNTGASPEEVVKSKGMTQITDPSAIQPVIAEIFAENEPILERYRAGQQNVKGFLIGLVMKKTGGQANPKLVQEIVQKELDQL